MSDQTLSFRDSQVDNTQGDMKYAIILDNEKTNIFVIKYTRLSQLINSLFKDQKKYVIHRILKHQPSDEELKQVHQYLY